MENITQLLLSNSIEVTSRHAVPCVGTNNLGREGTEIIERKYKELLDILETKNCE